MCKKSKYSALPSWRLDSRVIDGVLLVLGVLGFFAIAEAQEDVRLHIVDDGQQILLSVEEDGDSILRIEDSEDLDDWRSFFVAHGELVAFPDIREMPFGRRFYRLSTSSPAETDDWKNQIHVINEPFFATSTETADNSRWVKFMIELDAPYRVIFQDSAKYLFHFDFARERIGQFQDLDPLAFDEVTLYNNGQKAVLGAAILSPDPAHLEIGIQFAGDEAFPVEKVVEWFELVRSSIVAPDNAEFLYFPSFEQTAAAEDNADLLAQSGIHVGSAARWVDSDQCYSEGWAFGRLVFVPATDIEDAYEEGRLLPSDILVTDNVPAEIPPVAGTLVMEPATPNSHVAILSQSFQIPFAYLANADDQARVRSWEGQEILLLAKKIANQGLISTFNVQGKLSQEQRNRLLDAKIIPPLPIVPTASPNALSLPVDSLTSEDIQYVGGKAANFGVLRRAIPDHSPAPTIAFTFDLWNAFMDQNLADGEPLRQAIAKRLEKHRYPPENMATLNQDLKEIRSLIKDEADFTNGQKEAILEALAPFDTTRKIRFRSSTNVEDSDSFVGAGLYDSFSGCVLDDIDADSEGPSHCDPEKSSERGVFLAIRKVFASFYNDNAYLERLRHQVSEEDVGMAILVHYSFPDPFELANGVATLQISDTGKAEEVRIEGNLVTQKDAVSVANPDTAARPEVISFQSTGNSAPVLSVEQRSGLVPLGGSVLTWTDEYGALIGLLKDAARAYLAERGDRTEALLDFEYKLIAPRQLVVKQIREIPRPSNTNDQPPFVLNDIGRLDVFQHHGKDLFANYRLKSVWNFQALQIEGDTLGSAFDFITDLEYHDGETIQRFNGPMSQLPEAQITIEDDQARYEWRFGEGDTRRDFALNFAFSEPIEGTELVALSEANLIELSVNYAHRRPRLVSVFPPTFEFIRSESTRMIPLDLVIDRTVQRNRVFRSQGVTVHAAYELGFFKFPAPGIGIFDGKSFPLVNWVGPTRVEGLTETPFELTGNYSRTYDSNRHNFNEFILLTPKLDPNVDADTLAELEAKNIKGLLVSQWTADSSSSPSMFIWGFDDSLRDL